MFKVIYYHFIPVMAFAYLSWLGISSVLRSASEFLEAYRIRVNHDYVGAYKRAWRRWTSEPPTTAVQEWLSGDWVLELKRAPPASGDLLSWMCIAVCGFLAGYYLLKYGYSLFLFCYRYAVLMYLRAKQDIVGFQPERMMPGSLFEYSPKLPAFQCEIYGVQQGLEFKLGQAFLTKGKLITAWHVVEDMETLRLRANGNELDIENKFELIEGDIATMVFPQRSAQALGLSHAKLAVQECEKQAGLFTHATAFGQKSMGLVQPHWAFGYVTYAGSTIKGFSGAPYYLNKTVYGMHLGGSTVNLGVSSAYLSMVLEAGEEASEDYVINWIKTGREYQVEKDPYRLDYYRVRANGRYFLVEDDWLDEEIGRKNLFANAKKMEDIKEEKYSPSSSDEEEEDIPLAPRGAEAFLGDRLVRKNLAYVPEPGPQKRTVVLENDGMKKRSQDLKPQNLTEKDGDSMRGLESTLVQSNDPSTYTPESKKPKKKRQGRSLKQQNKQLKQRLAELTKSGSSTSGAPPV